MIQLLPFQAALPSHWLMCWGADRGRWCDLKNDKTLQNVNIEQFVWYIDIAIIWWFQDLVFSGQKVQGKDRITHPGKLLRKSQPDHNFLVVVERMRQDIPILFATKWR